MNRKKLKKKTYKAVIVNGKDVFLFGDGETKAATSRVFEWNTRSLRTQNSVNIITVIKLIIEALRDFDDFRRITILYDDEMIWLEEWSPLFQEIEVPYCWNHDVQFIFQNRCYWWWHGYREREERQGLLLLLECVVVLGGFVVERLCEHWSHRQSLLVYSSVNVYEEWCQTFIICHFLSASLFAPNAHRIVIGVLGILLFCPNTTNIRRTFQTIRHANFVKTSWYFLLGMIWVKEFCLVLIG